MFEIGDEVIVEGVGLDCYNGRQGTVVSRHPARDSTENYCGVMLEGAGSRNHFYIKHLRLVPKSTLESAIRAYIARELST